MFSVQTAYFVLCVSTRDGQNICVEKKYLFRAGRIVNVHMRTRTPLNVTAVCSGPIRERLSHGASWEWRLADKQAILAPHASVLIP